MSKKKHRKKYDFDQMSPVEVYKLVLTGKIKTFPPNTWNQPDSREYAVEIIRFLFEDILRWSDEEIKKNLCHRTFSDYKLCEAPRLYGGVFQTFDYAYPGRLLPWELARVPANCWTPENGVKAVKWLFEKKLRWSDERIKKETCLQLFNNNDLHGMLNSLYSNCWYRAIEAAYPGRFQAWEFHAVPKWYWTPENSVKAVKWLLEEKLQWTDEEIIRKLTADQFKRYGLQGMLIDLYNESVYRALDAAYPKRFRQMKLRYIPEMGVQAVKWLIEEQLRWTDEEIKKNLSLQVFKQYGLANILDRIYDSSPFRAIDAAYPGRFQPWELAVTPMNFWIPKNGVKAVKWLFEEKLQWTDTEIKTGLSAKLFKKHGLKGMLDKLYNGSPVRAIEAAYPGRFQPWELPSVPTGFWTPENGIKATKWLIEEKMKWSDEEIKENLTKKVFCENGLVGMIDKFYGSSPFRAIDAAYPGRFQPWELAVTPMGFWTPENVVKAVKWMIEEKLGWTDAEIVRKINRKVFYQYGLGWGFAKLYCYNIYKVLNAAYPGRFKPEDFRMRKKTRKQLIQS